MSMGAALREAHDAEAALAAELRRMGERHEAEPDIVHMTGTLAGWADAHVRRLGGHAARLDVDLAAEAEEGDRGGGRLSPEPGLLLLRDLRALHLAAARASLAWTALGQGAQAVRDAELLGTVTACHPQTVRTLKWTVQKVKEVSPQALAS